MAIELTTLEREYETLRLSDIARCAQRAIQDLAEWMIQTEEFREETRRLAVDATVTVAPVQEGPRMVNTRSLKLITLFTLLVSSSVQADEWNDLIQECSGGSKRLYRSISVEERGWRWGDIGLGALEALGEVTPGSVATVQLTVTAHNGQRQTFNHCRMNVIEDFDGTYISVNDCYPNGSTRSPAILCSITEETEPHSPRVNNGARRPESNDGAGTSERATGPLGHGN